MRACLAAAFAFAALHLSAAPRDPADRVGVYSILEDVVVEPASGPAERVQLWGAFIFAQPGGDGYGPATHGYLYYSCPAGRLPACREQWSDFQWFGGTGKGVGFGTRGGSLGRLRKDTDPLAAPDAYPLEGGLVKMESKDPSFSGLVGRLKTALIKLPQE